MNAFINRTNLFGSTFPIKFVCNSSLCHCDQGSVLFNHLLRRSAAISDSRNCCNQAHHFSKQWVLQSVFSSQTWAKFVGTKPKYCEVFIAILDSIKFMDTAVYESEFNAKFQSMGKCSLPRDVHLLIPELLYNGSGHSFTMR